jgi:hypothetical protein
MNTKINRKNLTSFDDHLTKHYGKLGSAARTEFEIKAKTFLIRELSKKRSQIVKKAITLNRAF